MNPCKFYIYSHSAEEKDLIIAKVKTILSKNGFVFDEDQPELIIVLGGDGTLLHAVHKYNIDNNKNIKYLLINTGHLGFYADFEENEIDEAVSTILGQEPTIEQIPYYDATINEVNYPFINDIAIQSGETVFLNVYVNNELLTESRCNGIVVASAVGTTGYLTSLGSPVVIHGSEVYQFSLLAPCFNRMYINPINKAILGNDQTLKIEIVEGEYDLYVDGRKSHVLHGNTILVQYHKESKVQLLHFKELSYVSRLRKNISGKE